MFTLLKKTPALEIGLLVAAQLAVLLPFFYGDKIRPLFFTYMDEVSLLALSPTIAFVLGHAALLTAVLLGASLTGKKWGVRVVGTVVVAHFLVMILGVLYYGNFGQYPRQTVIKDFLITPGSVIGYGVSGATPSDFVLGLMSAVLVLMLALGALFRIERSRSPGDACILSLTFAISFLMMGAYLVNVREAYGALRISQFHGTPTALLWGTISDAIRRSPANQPECAAPHLPIRPASAELPDIERPEHIILVIMESLRADHLPFYGYSRNTMPLQQAVSDEWIVFPNYRSAAPMTAASLRAILSSRYLQLASNEHAINECTGLFWQSLAEAGYTTALLSGADMRWHYLDKVTASHECDELIHYHTVSDDERSRFLLTDRSDRSLNDSFVVDRAGQFVQASGAPSFSLLYLMNVHQPYFSDPEDRRFSDADTPTVRADAQILEMDLSENHRTSILNQYDDSIVNFDKNLSRLLANLRREGVIERSVVIVTADHGEAIGDHNTFYHGTTLYDEQIKVPLMVRVGSELPKLQQALASNRDTISTGVDLAPTILTMVGSPLPDLFEGTPLTATNRKQYDFVFWISGYQMAAVFTATEKYVYDMETRVAQQFDLIDDPGETENTLHGYFEDFSSFLNYLEKQQVISRHSRVSRQSSTETRRVRLQERNNSEG